MNATDKTYRVNEIFVSLQGEGYHTGTAAVFLRFAGCNLQCPFCDTDHRAFRTMDARAIVEECSQYGPRHLVVTGGEPALQLDDALIGALHDAGFYIQIETNGTLPLPQGIDWVTCSPKDSPTVLDDVDELKIVYLEDDSRIIDLGNTIRSRARFVQPCSGLNTDRAVQFVLAHPGWRLSLQTHKLIDIQ